MELKNPFPEEQVEETVGLSVYVDFKDKIKRKKGWKLSPNQKYHTTKGEANTSHKEWEFDDNLSVLTYEEIKKNLEVNFLYELEEQLRIYLNNPTIKITHKETNVGSIELILSILGIFGDINDAIESIKNLKKFVNLFFRSKINNRYGDLFTVKTTIIKDTDTLSLKDIVNYFFWFCAGVKIEYIKKCPTDHIKYAGIGITIFVTALLAFSSGSYAFYTVFNNESTAISFGLLWAFTIFFWDRYLVSSIRKEGNWKKELSTALPRILIAVVISFIVSNPIELKLFEKEINLQLKNELIEFEKIKLKNSPLTADIDKTDSMIQEYRIKTIQREIKLQNLRDSLTTEVQGRLLDRLKGDGPAARTIRANYDSTQKEIYNFISKTKSLSDTLSLKKRIREDSVRKLVAEKQKTDGFLARNLALKTLRQDYPLVNAIYYWLAILILLLETAPIVVKILSTKGVYDVLIKKLEYREFAIHSKYIREKSIRILDDLKYIQHQELNTFDSIQINSSNIKVGDKVNEEVIIHLRKEHFRIQKKLSKKLQRFIRDH